MYVRNNKCCVLVCFSLFFFALILSSYCICSILRSFGLSYVFNLFESMICPFLFTSHSLYLHLSISDSHSCAVYPCVCASASVCMCVAHTCWIRFCLFHTLANGVHLSFRCSTVMMLLVSLNNFFYSHFSYPYREQIHTIFPYALCAICCTE